MTRSIVYTTYHAKRKKKEEREKDRKTAYITRHELPPPEPAMSSIDAESPNPLNQTTVPQKSRPAEEKQNKTVFIPTDPVQNKSKNESFSYQNYQNYHQPKDVKPAQSKSQPTKVSL